MKHASLAYRPDIDGLRAVAVCSVILYHAFPGLLRGGFVGVDVFFVISGFLISSIVLGQQHTGAFSLRVFYSRRIARIFPALVTVLSAVLIFGILVLFRDELVLLSRHTLSGATFSSNLLLWSESGYFDKSADVKPLLHLWSLGIEEQYYIVWPLVLWLLRTTPTLQFFSLVTFAVASFGFNVYWIDSHSVGAFYSPLTRAWELLAGAGLAWLSLPRKGASRPYDVVNSFLAKGSVDAHWLHNALSIAGLLLVGTSCIYMHGQLHYPGAWASVPVTGALLVIAAGPLSIPNRYILSNNIAVFTGLISYPLYLWHWPLLSFARILKGDTPNRDIRVVLVMAAFAFASATYHAVEKPIRSIGASGRTIRRLIAAMAVIGTASAGISAYEALNDPHAATEEFMLSAAKRCDSVLPLWSRLNDNECRLENESGNNIAIIGDSHAGHLFLGLSQRSRASDGVAVYPASCAAPYIDIAAGQNDAKSRPVRQHSFELINAAYRRVLDDPAVKYVVLAHNPACSWFDAKDLESSEASDFKDALKAGMRRTFAALTRANKRALVVLDAPTLPFDPIRCAKRLTVFSADKGDCSVERDQLPNTEILNTYRALVNEVATDFPDVHVIDLTDLFCSNDSCRISVSGEILYDDRNHLSDAGSMFVAPEILRALYEHGD